MTVLGKLKGGALQLTLFITIIIALLLFAFILLINTHTRFNAQSNHASESIQNASNGFVYGLSDIFPINTNINYSSENDRSLDIHKSYWGIYEKISVVSKVKKSKFEKTALIGGFQTQYNRPALYLKDNGKPLVLVGNTKIKGTSYLSNHGVKPGSISGQGYTGAQLIYGTTKQSIIFPKLNTELTEHLNVIFKKNSNTDNYNYITVAENLTLENSFYEPLQIIYSKQDIQLSHIKITGHIKIQSETKIIIEPTASLKDVVLVAPEIMVNDNTTGVFQAIASRNITVGKNCNLMYPSALVLKSQHNKSESNENEIQQVSININSNIEGIIIALNGDQNESFDTQMLIEKNATVIGEVYADHNIELRGAVFGSAYTHSFIANQSGSVYLNYIHSGQIISDQLNENYAGLALNNSTKNIVKWLY